MSLQLSDGQLLAYRVVNEKHAVTLICQRGARKKLCQDMKHCRFVFICDTGHYLLDEQAQRVVGAIEEFLKER